MNYFNIDYARKFEKHSVHVAHVGNSIQYFNDCPRLLEKMIRYTVAEKLWNNDPTIVTSIGSFTEGFVDSSWEEERDKESNDDSHDNESLMTLLNKLVQQDSCFRGGAHFHSLWHKGNGMQHPFSSRPESLLVGTPRPRPSVSNTEDQHYDIGAPTVRQLFLEKKEHGEKDKIKSGDNDTADDDTTKFWDYIIMNDHTQWPVRPETKKQSLAILTEEYLPTIVKGMMNSATGTKKATTTTTTIIFLQTAAYQLPGIHNSHDLGTFEEYTHKLHEGYQEYVTAVRDYAVLHAEELQGHTLQATIAPFGAAYQLIHNDDVDNQENAKWIKDQKCMFPKLYTNDDYHPSPHGTLLEACLLHLMVMQGTPFDVSTMFHNNEDMRGHWWRSARYLPPPPPQTTSTTDGKINSNTTNQEPPPASTTTASSLPFPSPEEAFYLNEIARQVYRDQLQYWVGGETTTSPSSNNIYHATIDVIQLI